MGLGITESVEKRTGDGVPVQLYMLLATNHMAQLLKKERLDLHGNLAKAESSLAVQVRTEKIGFAQFLHRLRVLAVTSPACDCGWHSQTAKHIAWYCHLRPHRQWILPM